MTMKRWHLFTSFSLALALLAGCTTLDEKQRAWIFQPSDRTWSGGAAAAVGMDDVWIDFTSAANGQPVRLHGLWLASDKPDASQAPVMLYLHGARYNVTGSAPRMRRMQELGFSVLAIDYRGFGKSTNELPSEKSAYEDARAAWDWLAKNTRTGHATSSATRWAGPSPSTWPLRSPTSAAPLSKAPSPPSPTW
jgi:acetyl esterase/lipase